jgi:hypothetical protein
MDIVTHMLPANDIVQGLFKITIEKNIPSLFSTLQLMLSGGILSTIYVSLQNTQKQPSQNVVSWKYLSWIFYFLAIDEWFTVHDTLGSFVSDYMGHFGELFGWTLPYIIIMIGFALWSIQFLRRLPRSTAILLIISGLIFLFGAIGCELLNTREFQSQIGIQLNTVGSYLIGLLEESCEMVGILLFNLTLFIYGTRHANTIFFSISKPWYIGFLLFGILDTIATMIMTHI